MQEENKNISTKLVHSSMSLGTDVLSPQNPIINSATMVFPDLKSLIDANETKCEEGKFIPYNPIYGRAGTQTNSALEQAIADLEGYDYCITTASGLNAITAVLASYLKKGDHLLIVESVFGKTSSYCEILKSYGVEIELIDSCADVSEVEAKIKSNTKLVFLESPISTTFDIQDIPEICKVAKKRGILTAMDNSWSAGVLFDAKKYGVDISIQSASKYLSGHSDVIMGSICMNAEQYQRIFATFRVIGSTVSPFSAYLVRRGMQTMKLRLEKTQENALKIAKWLEDERDDIIKVLNPALESHHSHNLWKKYFTGTNGLITFVLDKKYSVEELSKMTDGMKIFALGHSWGGCESLITNVTLKSRYTKDYSDKSALRIFVGIEDFTDIKKDLEEGLNRLKK